MSLSSMVRAAVFAVFAFGMVAGCGGPVESAPRLETGATTDGLDGQLQNAPDRAACPDPETNCNCECWWECHSYSSQCYRDCVAEICPFYAAPKEAADSK